MSRALWFFVGFVTFAASGRPKVNRLMVLSRVEALKDGSSIHKDKRRNPKRVMKWALQPQISQIHADKKSTTTPDSS
jgi:hypothetical protein